MKKYIVLFAVMAMSVMTLTAGAINIPQAAVGDYILIGDGSTNPKTTATGVTLTKCQVDGSSATSYTVGSTGAQTQIDFALNATVAGDYLFSFMSGSDGYTAKLSLSLKNSSSEEIWSGTADIINTGAWALTTRHLFAVGNLSVDTYTMTIKVTERAQDGGTGGYAGNYGNFCFHTATQYPWPSSSELNMEHGTYENADWNGDKVINNIRATGASIDNLIAYNATESFYKFCFNITYLKQNSKIGITITDVATGNVEISNQTLEITANGDKEIRLYNSLAAGWKKIRFNFTDNDPSNDNTYLYNFQTVTLPAVTYDALPVESALNLEHGTYDHANWNSDNVVNYIKAAGASIDDLYVNNVGEGFYKFCFTIEHLKQNSKVGITITDVKTGDVEIDNQTLEITGNGDKEIRLYKSLSVGLKKIRFDFTDNDSGNSDEHLFNFKTVTLPAVSYDALPLTGESVLDLSGLTSGNPRYQEENHNLGWIYHNGTASFYVNNTNPTAHYHLSAGIRTNVSDANLIVTVTDVATGNAEINEEAFDVAEGGGSYPIQTFALSGAITPGLKLITFKFTKDDETTSQWLYNINNISFTMLHYTREHPHMNLNTLCFPYQIDYYTGATFYTMLYKKVENAIVTDVYLQEHVGALEAGTPYFYVPDEGETELVCYYSGDREDTPQKVNGVQGAYDDDTPVPAGAYVTYNNIICIVGDPSYVTLAEYRAYIDMSAVSGTPVAAAPGRRLLSIRNADAPAVTTGIENTSAKLDGSQKVLRNGQLFIIRDGKTYNAFGQTVK